MSEPSASVDEVWADEGGVSFRVETIDAGHVRVSIRAGIGSTEPPLAACTLGRWRWDRIARALDAAPAPETSGDGALRDALIRAHGIATGQHVQSEAERLARVGRLALATIREAIALYVRDDEPSVLAERAVDLVAEHLATVTDAAATLREWAMVEAATVRLAEKGELVELEIQGVVDAAVARERERILGLMAHSAPCQQNDATCPHEAWSACLTAAIRQAPRP